MHSSNRLSSRSIPALALAAALLIPGISALGDTVYIKSTPTATPFARKNVTISKIAKDKDEDFESLYYTTDGGNNEHKDLAKVSQIEADNEPSFNQAETEFEKNDLKAASEDYRRAMASSTKEWVKHRSNVRLLLISGKTGDFLGAVAGYVEMVKKDPVAAAAQKPVVASAKPDQLASAITTVNRGLAGASSDTKRTLLPFLIELQTKNNDNAGATASLAELKKLTGGAGQNNPANSTGAADATAAAMAAKEAEADIALNKAKDALAARDYAKVISSINTASASFITPDHQAKALYMLAEAKAATATTPDALEDAAMAYMRVVAHFKAQIGGPAADALYKTGVIEEKLSKTREAILIYKQVVNEYADSKAAEQAKAALERLK
ncbi:MAG TPA: hypothetical protein VFE47_17270 [Tepidisphaeraceae bacterium]|jgi:TolA-binding protein|nr:hypothetical protein [Tepidisphaeraceae bacterium]